MSYFIEGGDKPTKTLAKKESRIKFAKDSEKDWEPIRFSEEKKAVLFYKKCCLESNPKMKVFYNWDDGHFYESQDGLIIKKTKVQITREV